MQKAVINTNQVADLLAKATVKASTLALMHPEVPWMKDLALEFALEATFIYGMTDNAEYVIDEITTDASIEVDTSLKESGRMGRHEHWDCVTYANLAGGGYKNMPERIKAECSRIFENVGMDCIHLAGLDEITASRLRVFIADLDRLVA